METTEPAQTARATDARSTAFIRQFGAFLTDNAILDELTVRRAERAQRQSGERFDVVLSRLGLLDEAGMAKALAGYLGLPLLGPADFPGSPLFADQLQAAYLSTAKVLPVSDDGQCVILAMADPLDSEAASALSFLLERRIEPVVAAGGAIAAAIARLHGEAAAAQQSRQETAFNPAADEQGGEDDVRRLQDMASEAPIIRLVHDLIAQAAELHASDIHMEPGENGLLVRMRIDGVLHSMETLPQTVRAAVISRIKIMAHLNIAERRIPQDGRIQSTVRGRPIDLRVATMPTINGESVVLRLLDRSSVQLDFAALGLAEGIRAGLTDLLAQPNGIILVTGPTGSGKTTTLYTALSLLNDPRRKTFTVEDPIEYQLGGVSQIQVQPKIGLNFAAILRSVLRQDPDVIMVGEIRDLETARVAIQASLTGHLVLSTVHTNSAAGTIARMIDMGVEGYLLASTLKGVLAQRLVRRLCEACAAPAEADPVLLSSVAEAGLQAELGAASLLRRPVGCPACRHTGFRGRTIVGELLVMSEAVQDAMLKAGTERAVQDAALASGMKAMFRDGVAKVLRGEVTLDEVLSVTRMHA